MHGAGLQLGRDKAGAVLVLVVDRPVPVGDHGMDGEDRENRQHLEQGWMLRVVGQIVVEDGQRA